MTNRKPVQSGFPTATSRSFWDRGKRAIIVEMQNRTEERKNRMLVFLANILADDAPRIVQNNAIKPISMTCHDNQGFFPPWCQVCPGACLLLVRNSISHQIKQNKRSHVWLISVAQPRCSTFGLFALPNEGWKSQMCWMPFKIWRHHEGQPQSRHREVQGIHNDTWLVVILVSSDGLTHLSSD